MTTEILSAILTVCVSTMAWGIPDSAKTISSNGSHLLFQLKSSEERSQEKPKDVFAGVTNVLRKQTQVPPRLPNLALVYKDTSGLYAILEEVNSSHYFIQIALSEDCADGTNCHGGSVIGSVEPISVKNGQRIPVALHGGIKGFFVPADCGAHCDDSSINWKEGSFYYSISLKAAKKGVMVRLANSAIEDHAGR